MTQQTFTIGNMDCANCAREVETGVSKLAGVKTVQVNFSNSQMILDGDVDYETLKERVEALGKTLDAPDNAAEPDSKRGGVLGFWDYLVKRPETRLALVGGVGILFTLVASLLFAVAEPVTGVLYTIFMVIVLLPIARSGLNTLLINREFNINLLMTIAALGAVIIGEYLESATVIFLFTIGEALEGYTADRARDSLRSLLDLTPNMALRVGSTNRYPSLIWSLAMWCWSNRANEFRWMALCGQATVASIKPQSPARVCQFTKRLARQFMRGALMERARSKLKSPISSKTTHSVALSRW